MGTVNWTEHSYFVDSITIGSAILYHPRDSWNRPYCHSFQSHRPNPDLYPPHYPSSPYNECTSSCAYMVYTIDSADPNHILLDTSSYYCHQDLQGFYPFSSFSFWPHSHSYPVRSSLDRVPYEAVALGGPYRSTHSAALG